MDEFQVMFALVRDQLRKELSSTIFDVWLSELRPVSFEDGCAVLSLPEFKRKITEQKFMKAIHKSFEAALGITVEVRLIDMPPGGGEAVQEISVEQPTPADRLPHGHEGNTFDTFVVGGSNKFAHAAAQAVAATPGKLYNPLFIHGNSGLGKTHLLSAIYHEVKRLAGYMNIVYITGEEFSNELIGYIATRSTTQFREKYRNAEMLLVDDVQFIAGKESTQEEFFHTFNVLTQNNRQVVLTSDKPPKDIATLEDRLRSRFDAGLIADVQPPDLETRMAIVKRKAQDTGFDISDDMVDYIARQLKSNIRQLEGAVNRIEALVTLRGMPLTLATAQHAIADIVSTERPLPVTIECIIEEAARAFSLNSTDLRSKRRSSDISHARQVAMYIISQVTGQSTKAIGAEFQRDHSTVVYALREIRDEIARDASLRKLVNEITKVVQEN
ncbi:MAG: chromosomal replication initiator protein DnaA [Oscillospiraceae bacterium]|jgi:chromosomal replication initiator protein|nr:chromosomal replication initiator protein DnaA [Oscillospiraceae bacterium]